MSSKESLNVNQFTSQRPQPPSATVVETTTNHEGAGIVEKKTEFYPSNDGLK